MKKLIFITFLCVLFFSCKKSKKNDLYKKKALLEKNTIDDNKLLSQAKVFF